MHRGLPASMTRFAPCIEPHRQLVRADGFQMLQYHSTSPRKKQVFFAGKSSISRRRALKGAAARTPADAPRPAKQPDASFLQYSTGSARLQHTVIFLNRSRSPRRSARRNAAEIQAGAAESGGTGAAAGGRTVSHGRHRQRGRSKIKGGAQSPCRVPRSLLIFLCSAQDGRDALFKPDIFDAQDRAGQRPHSRLVFCGRAPAARAVLIGCGQAYEIQCVPRHSPPGRMRALYRSASCFFRRSVRRAGGT